jgi:hypothetical protein
MRATPATRHHSFSCRGALLVTAGVVLAGAAWAETDQPAGVVASLPVTMQEGSSQAPPAAAKSPQQPTATNVSAEVPRGASGGDDRRLLMLMMLGRVGSGGVFGRLGQ